MSNSVNGFAPGSNHGDASVGKSNLLLRFAEGLYSSAYVTTVGLDFVLFTQRTKTVRVDDQVVMLQMWELAGDERFRAVAEVYYRCANVCLVLLDVTLRSTFWRVQNFVAEARRLNPTIICQVVGSRCDLEEERQVRSDEPIALANRLKTQYIEISAKMNVNIDSAFINILRPAIQEIRRTAEEAIITRLF